jgi:hypothetical protein
MFSKSTLTMDFRDVCHRKEGEWDNHVRRQIDLVLFGNCRRTCRRRRYCHAEAVCLRRASRHDHAFLRDGPSRERNRSNEQYDTTYTLCL